MKKYIVESWLKVERVWDDLEMAQMDKRAKEESNHKDIKIIEVNETRKEI